MARENEARLELTAVDSVTQVIKGVQGSVQSLQRVYGQLAAAMGISLGAGAFVAFIDSGISAMASLRRLSDQTGATVESLSALRSVAKLSGTDMEQVALGAAKLSKAMLEVAQTGAGKSATAFKALGVEVLGSTGQLRASDQVMQEVAQKLFEMENGTQRVAYAQLLFGKSGATLLPFLRELAEAGVLNATVTSEQADAAKRWEDNLVRLKASTTALKISLASELLPSLNAMAEAMLLAKRNGEGFFATIGAGLATLFGGSDRHRSDRDLVWQTEKLLDLQNQMDLEKPGTTAYNAFKGQIADLRALITTTTSYRKILDDVDADEAKRKAKRRTIIPLDIATGAAGAADDGSREAIRRFNLVEADRERLQHDAMELDRHTTKTTLERMDAQQKLNEQLEAEAENYRKLGDPARQYYQQLERVDLLMQQGVLSAGEWSAATKRLWEEIEKTVGATKKAQDEMTEFTLQAARNMQNAMGTFFFDVMEGRMSNLASGFTSMLNRMVAEAAAANLGKYLFGDFGKTGELGGAAGGFINSALKTVFGGAAPISAAMSDSAQFGIPAFATGTDFVPRTGLAVVHQGERIVPADTNRRGGMPPVIVYISTPDIGSFRASESQVAAQMSRALARGQRNL